MRVSPGLRRPIPGGHKCRESVPWKGAVCLSSPPLLLRDQEHTSLIDTYHYPESSNVIKTMKQNTVQDRPHEPDSSSAPGSSDFLLPCLHGARQLCGALQPLLPLHSAQSEHGSSQQCAPGRRGDGALPSRNADFHLCPNLAYSVPDPCLPLLTRTQASGCTVTPISRA